ncbi:MAG: UDP-N-acetylmuramate--L-alanine ligase [bacterium]|nr:UDP-N-acetylmuramate--L-alanine ligase [bacterium]
MYKKKAHIHFIGIGGIGMSGIATILKYQGYTISGCDTDFDQQSIKNLQVINCIISEGNNTRLCADKTIDILVYSSAIKADNPEIIAAQERGIATIPRALMLAELMRTKYSVAIAGAHGKTTTTSLISHILIEAGMDPTVIIGGHLKTISHNARFGGGNFLVAEVDESDRSLLQLHPTLAVVTNIDLEHLETYKNLDDIKQTFKQFLSNVPFYGKAFVCTDDTNLASILPIPHIKTVRYGIDQEADFFASAITLYPDYSTFTVHTKNNNIPLGTIHLNMPGKHNILNTLGAISLARDLDVPFEIIARALQNFKGIERRFSYRGTHKGAEIFDDYGHHPKEIENALLVARKRTKNKLTVVFQPHRYTRTYHLWNLFIKIFLASDIDHLIITDIYPASEAPIANITSERLVQELRAHNPHFSLDYVPFQENFAAIKQKIENLIEPDDLLLLLGAGKMNKLPEKLT